MAGDEEEEDCDGGQALTSNCRVHVGDHVARSQSLHRVYLSSALVQKGLGLENSLSWGSSQTYMQHFL